MAYNLGVDLGTTFVAAAVAHPSQVEMFTLGDRSVVVPSVVYLRDDGVLVSGDAAGRRAVSNPDRVGREFKRRLGDPTPVMLGGTPYTVTALLGALLRDVLTKVTETEGEPPNRVVLTHPANWGPFRRALFEEVPGLAGLTDVTLVTEPEAAAAHYAASRQLDDGEVVAVYDLGGGTFDATVLRKRADGVEILGTPEGIERLGGVDFDEAILSHVNVAAGGALSELDLGDPKTTIALARLRQDCVLAKEALSVDTEAVLPVFLPGRHFDVRITREEFENLIRAQIESTIGALSRTLRSAQVTSDQLSAVLLVGGSSRIPLIAEMVSEELNRPTVVDTHPKYAVALGAATLAGAPPTNGAGTAAGSGVASRGRKRRPPVETVEPAFTAAGGVLGATHPRPSGSSAPTASAPTSAPTSVPTPSLPTAAPDAPGNGQSRTGGAPPPPAAASPPAGASGPAVPPGQPPGPYAFSGPEPDPDGWAMQSTLRRRRIIVLAVLAVVAAAAVVFGSAYVINSLRAGPGATTQASGSAAESPAVNNPAATAPPVAPVGLPTVPIPSLGSPIPIGKTPDFVAVSPNGRLAYVANGDAKTVTVLDTSVNRVIATIPVDAGPPQFLTFSPDGRRIYISIFNDARTIAVVGVLDTYTNQIVGTIPVRTRPFRGAVTADGKLLYVPNHDSGTVAVIDTQSLKLVKEIQVPPNPHWISFSKDGTRAYMANHESNVIGVLDVATSTVIAQIPVGKSPHALAVHPSRPLVANVNYDANTVSMIDTDTNEVTATIPVGKNPQSIMWTADGRFAYVVNNGDNTVSVINGETNQVTATIPTGPTPTNVALLPDDRLAYVTNEGNGTLTVLNPGG